LDICFQIVYTGGVVVQYFTNFQTGLKYFVAFAM
jgi:hypothetical protein